MAIGAEGARDFEFKLGNYGCFRSSGHVWITVDGANVWDRSYSHGWWNHCGWQWDVHWRVDKNMGAVSQTYYWGH